jgi:hypothetical protein
MAVAPYFQKAAAGAADILAGISPSEVTALVQELAIGISFDSTAANTFEGRCTLDLLVNLLSRLFPTIALLPTGRQTAGLADELAAQAQRINPNIELLQDASVNAYVAVGQNTPPLRGIPSVYAGSDGWIAKIASSAPVGVGNSHNPFGAGAAACFAAANAFRTVFAAHLQNGAPDQEFALSLIDLDPGARVPRNDCALPQDLGECAIVGLGAIGNATVWALAKMEDLRGQLELIDHDVIDDTNPQRYVLTDPTCEGRSKVELAATHLGNTRLALHSHQLSWAGYLGQQENWVLPLVAVAVDTPDDRCAIQGSLPRVALNAWTQPADLGISRHLWTNDQACLACLYTPIGQRKSEDTLVAEAIHFAGDIMELRTMLYHDTPLDEQWITRIEGLLSAPAGTLQPFAGKSLRHLYRRGICGGVIFSLTGQQSPTRVEVPMAFQSALAGILLGAEMALYHSLPDFGSRPVITRIDLLRPLAHTLSEPERKHEGCICGDPDYQAAYAAKYPPHDSKPHQDQPEDNAQTDDEGDTQPVVAFPQD